MRPTLLPARLVFPFVAAAIGSGCLQLPAKAVGTTSKAAVKGLRLFIQATADRDHERAYSLVSESAKRRSDATIEGLMVSRDRFVEEAGLEDADIAFGVDQAALRSRPAARVDRQVVLTTSRSATTFPGSAPTVARRRLKMDDYTLGEPVVVNARRVEIPIAFRVPGGGIDRDRAVMVLEKDRWLVANPIHLIR